MSHADESKTVDRPCTDSLITALHDTIHYMAIDKMTYIEIVGCLHLVAASYLPKD